MVSGDSTVVVRSPHHPKVKGSNLAAAVCTARKKKKAQKKFLVPRIVFDELDK
jgi:hypothetical protein